MNLATLQSQFAKALHYQALGEDCDIASDEFTADERMQIYRNNFIVSLSEVLSATYPIDRKSTRLNSSHTMQSRMPSSA